MWFYLLYFSSSTVITEIPIETETSETKLTLKFNTELTEVSILILVDFASAIWYTAFLRATHPITHTAY